MMQENLSNLARVSRLTYMVQIQGRERHHPLIFLRRIKSVIKAFNEDNMEEPNYGFEQARDKVIMKWLMVGRIFI